jgi:hypothetical protein
MQKLSASVALDFIVELFDVVSQAQNENFDLHFYLSPQ